MIKFNNSFIPDRKRKTIRDTSLRSVTNKFESKKERLCLKCGEKFLSKRSSNRICEKCSLINEKIELKLHSVSNLPQKESELFPIS